MEAIKETVAQVIQGMVEKKIGLAENDPAEWLKKVLTKKELGHIKFNYFKKGIITVNVDSSSMLYSLTLQKEKLLEKFVKYSDKVRDIRFRIGEIV